MMRFIAVAACFAWSAHAGAQQEGDSIILKDGNKEVKCKVTSATMQGVQYTEGGKAKSLPPEQVRDIFLTADEPESLRKANLASDQKNWDKAIPLYIAALEDVDKQKCRTMQREFVLFNLANAQLHKGSADDALQTLKRLRKECKGGWMTRKSYDFSMDVARKKGEAELMEVLAEMKTEPQPLGGEAELQIARSKYAKQDYKGAQEIAARLSRTSGQPYVSTAKVLSIRCLRALKDMAGLKTVCEEVMANKATAEMSLLQAAASGLGDILMADPSNRREALLAYAQAIAMGPPPKEEGSDDYASALYNAAKCYLALATAPKVKEEVLKDYRARAVLYFRETVENYKTSAWGKPAETELASLGLGPKPKEAPKEPKKPEKPEK